MNYKEFLTKFKNESPLNCYTECVSIENDCIKCSRGIQSKFPCPFKVLLEVLKQKNLRRKKQNE